jgi:two-component system chemotaxis response regulator CheY
MPDVDGLQLVKAMRAHPKLQKTGIILMTGRKDEKIVKLAQQFQVNMVLAKPFTETSLRSAIESVVGRLN